MRRWEAWWNHAALVAVSLTGVLYGVFKYFVPGLDPDSRVGHPLQLALLKAHILVAPFAVAETSSMPSTELRRDHVIFAAAMAVETAHLLDDVLLNPHDGVTHVPSALTAVAISVAAVALYGRLATWARIVLAALFGLAGLVAGFDMHVFPALQHGAEGSDHSGFGQAAAGLVLLGLATVLVVTQAGRRPAPQ